jgi:glyoxylase-like metal-dependent hydrolase (beta-lactamase superfamily II)
MTTLTFLGAARTVTGSKFLVGVDKTRVLIDCGLFQGLKDLRLRNWQPLPFEPSGIKAVVLTHAHLDHTGYLPKLVAAGYRGRVFCTPGTADLCRLVLPDSARLQEEDAREANRLSYSKHSPALPLYYGSDAFRALSLLHRVGFNTPISLEDGIDVEFINAGHLLGSSFVKMTIRGRQTILFGGDLGRYSRPVLLDPSVPRSTTTPFAPVSWTPTFRQPPKSNGSSQLDFSPFRRRSNRQSPSDRKFRQSSCRRAAWRREDEFSIICSARCPTSATRCCSWATRPKARAGGISRMGHEK